MPPASGSNNNTSNAAVQAAAKAEREEKLRGALKSFILKERQRKKEGTNLYFMNLKFLLNTEMYFHS